MSPVRRSVAVFFATFTAVATLGILLLAPTLSPAAEASPQVSAPVAADASTPSPVESPEQQDSAPPADNLFSPTYQACMDEAAGVTTRMQDCMSAEQERLETRLTAQRARVVATLNQERAKAFNGALEAWDVLRKSGSIAMFDPDGGTLSPLMASLWYLEQTARMARWVDGLQEGVEE